MNTAIIVAGGKGLRMKDAVRKQYLLLGGLPVLSHTVKAFSNCEKVDSIILVVPADDIEYCRKEVVEPLSLEKPLKIVSGGKERQESVYKGLCAVDDTDAVVLIHDGVRPFISNEKIEECISLAEKNGACILAIDAFDTLKSVDEEKCITGTIDRSTVRLAQTPQAFQYRIIKDAHDKAIRDGFTGTDDASMVEFAGGRVSTAEGSRNNIKITTKEDLVLANAIIQAGIYF